MPNWKVLPKVSDDLILQLLHNRGLKTEKEINDFLNPSLENFQKDLEIPGIKKAWERIQKAILKQELIIVYGDYDVDGITACAILYKALTFLGGKVLPYIPHREKEGYGLSKLGLEFARDSGASLVITVDNGIVALEQAKFAKEIGLDLIITDHHLPLEEKPDALAIVHSTKMCGAGVAWCLIQEKLSTQFRQELLQFVAIATVCDMIPLSGLGRAFVKTGLRVLQNTKNQGLLALMDCSGITREATNAYEIGHVIGPRLNAVGRMSHAIDALRLLCTKDPVKAHRLARLLCDANSERQLATLEAIKGAHLKVDWTKNIQILASPDWSPGIIGLVAGRISETYFKPSIAISVGESVSKGSARSTNGINIVEVIRQCSDILIDVGGHKGAAGFSIMNENIDLFKTRMEKLLEEVKEQENVLEIEAEVKAESLTKALAKNLEKFEPFGFGNLRPLFLTKELRISDIKTVGVGKHLKFRANGIDCIAFGMGDKARQLKSGQVIDVVYFLEINKFNGREVLQLQVKDFS